MNAPPSIPVIIEVHVDEWGLEDGADPGAWIPLLEEIAAVAEARKGRLTFRFRERLAREVPRKAGTNLLLGLERRGHEVGTHAHGKNLGAASRAVAACRVANRGVSPGMVQEVQGFGALFDACVGLGFHWITDAPPVRVWSGGGLVPWRPGPGYSPFLPPSGPVSLEVSADPFAWGLLRRTPEGIVHARGLTVEHFEALGRQLQAHARREVPEGTPRYFSFAVHEHNFTEPGSHRATRASLDAFSDFLEGLDVVPAGDVAALLPGPGAPRATPTQEQPPPSLVRSVRMTGIRTMGLNRVRRRIRQHLDRIGPDPQGTFQVRAGDDPVHACWHGSRDPRGVLFVSHAGDRGGTAVLFQPFGVALRDLLAEDIAVVAWDRRGTGRSPTRVDLTPGALAAVEDFQAVWDGVSQWVAEDVPLGVLSFSSGILPALRSGRDLAFLLDGEAPADRWSVLPPQLPSSPDIGRVATWGLDDDDAWAGREPRLLLERIRCPYHRFQAELDHVHGRFDLHARLMVEAARKAGLPQVRLNGGDPGTLLPGRLHAHGPLLRTWIMEAFGA